MPDRRQDLAKLVALSYVETYCRDSIDNFQQIWDIVQLKERGTEDTLQEGAPAFSFGELTELANTPLAVAVIAALVPIIYDALKTIRRRRHRDHETLKSSQELSCVLRNKRVQAYQLQVGRKLASAASTVNLKQVVEYSVTYLIEHPEVDADDL
jgi:hypothetical protein